MVSHSIVGTRSPPICIWLANLSLHHKHVHGLSRFLSGHLSIAHAPPSISPTYSPLTISRGSLYHKHTLSPSACVHVLHVSLSTFVPCWPDLYWTCAIGVSLSVANNHTLAIFVYLLASLFYLGDACVICSPKKPKNTLSLSNLSFVVTFSVIHILVLHTYSFSFTRTWSVLTEALSSVHSI